MGKSSKYAKRTTRPDAGATFVFDAPPSVRWRVWPLLDQPTRGVWVLAAAAFAGLLANWATGRPQLGVLVSLVLIAAVWRFFLPTSFELDRNGLNHRRLGHRRRISWKAIRGHEHCKAGVLLLPHTDACPMDHLRGIYLPWGENRAEVLAHIEFHLGGRG